MNVLLAVYISMCACYIFINFHKFIKKKILTIVSINPVLRLKLMFGLNPVTSTEPDITGN